VRDFFLKSGNSAPHFLQFRLIGHHHYWRSRFFYTQFTFTYQIETIKGTDEAGQLYPESLLDFIVAKSRKF